MIKDFEFDYKGGRAMARIRPDENVKLFQYDWIFIFEGARYGDSSKWSEYPGDDKTVSITKKHIDGLLGQLKKAH